MITTLAYLLACTTPGEPFDVTVSDEEFNGIVPLYLEKNALLPVSDVVIAFTPGLMNVSANGTLVGMTVKAKVTGTLNADDGAVRFDPETIDLNDNPAPPFVRNMVVGRVNDRLRSGKVPFTVDTIEPLDGAVHVTGRTRAATE